MEQLCCVDSVAYTDGQIKDHFVVVAFIAMPDREPVIMEPNKADRLEWFTVDTIPDVSEILEGSVSIMKSTAFQACFGRSRRIYGWNLNARTFETST